LGGILLSAGAGYFLTNKTALFISSEYNFVQSLYLPSETIFREHPQRIEIGTFDEIKIRPSSFDIMIGVRRNF
jgi:outer membrane protease